MCKLGPYYLVNYNKMCILYFIGKQSDMLNDVDFVSSIFKHYDQAMELKASWLRKENLCLM